MPTTRPSRALLQLSSPSTKNVKMAATFRRRQDGTPVLHQYQYLLLRPILLLCLLLATNVGFQVEAHLRGQLSPAEAARRRRERRKAELCHPTNLEECGHGEGVLVCEYEDNDQHHHHMVGGGGGYYATRCVKKNSFPKHVGLHIKNYCGACHKCFQNTDELQSAVQKYIQNGTQNTNIARIYGWPIGTWCVDAVTDFSHLFSGQNQFNEDIGGWDVRRATNMASMFLDAFEFDQDLSDWNTQQVTDMSLMFDRAYSFRGNGLGTWDVSRVTSFTRMFRIGKKFQEDLSSWDTTRSTDMSLMFYRAELFNQPLGDWNVARVTDLSYAFAFAKSFNQSLANWQTSSATTVRGMFQSADSFVQDLTSWDVQRVTDMSFMFSNAHAFADQQTTGINGDDLLKAWNLKSVEYKDQMFGVISPLFNQTTISSSVLSDLRPAAAGDSSSSY